ncbi:DEAD/DEAH box helicase [Priestia megaterium]|uniref:DEAD/DEAH box helicase n=1 Tax=Priestia megaterium TaxID=1404 RepID=UPI0022203484|nr:DEAD/DEAH box helicase [Priestia megaterium]UYV50701.1 DEAD/DEAH box helicase [Priestia megaterium]
MNDVYKIFNSLLDTFIKYMDSPFALGHEKLTEEREELLRKTGNIYQFPYIEALPSYISSNYNVTQMCEEIDWDSDFGQFAGKGLFHPDHKLHLHQYEAFTQVLKQKKNVVVTSGTGSGKTESFLLPLIASILEEAKKWNDSEKVSDINVWDTSNQWHSKREGEKRTAAVRGLILYPLNALVEDQLVRLRKALDSDSARDWLKENRGGNQIYFGRYTGKTPVAGHPNGNKVKKMKEFIRDCYKKQEGLKEYFGDLITSLDDNLSFEVKRKITLELQDELGLDYLNNEPWDNEKLQAIKEQLQIRLGEKLAFISQTNGAELISRWDMQEYPPDILITNFSMLNIILTRSIEQNIFEKTKDWLQEDSSNVFYLVLDELHTYRGTAGTEVSYVIKSLLNRLGLTPDSPQLRILATSASLDETGKQFLEDFFGVPIDKFEIINGERQSESIYPEEIHFNSLKREFAEYYVKSKEDFTEAAKMLCESFRKPFSSESLEESLYNLLYETGAMHAFIKYTKKPVSILELSKRMFGTVENIETVAGLLHAIINSRKNDQVVVPIRAHLFFRNFQGLWACTNKSCTEVDPRFQFKDRTVGKLYSQPKIQCNCGSKVLDLYYCQNCGDLFLGGYKSVNQDGLKHSYHLSAEYDDLEKLPDKLPPVKRYGHYALFWPSLNIDEDIKKKWKRKLDYPDQDKKLTFEWIKGTYDHKLGKLTVDNFENSNAYVYMVTGDEERKNRMPAFPIRCPHCADDWEISGRFVKDEPLESIKRTRSPIRGQRTGFDTIAQIMLDALMRELPENEKPKAVLFSDSRQDAAKLSAKIEMNHYYHLLRHIVVKALNGKNHSVRIFLKKLRNELLSPQEEEIAELFWNEEYDKAMLLDSYLSNRRLPPHKLEEAAKIIDNINRPVRLGDLWWDIEKAFIKLGMNSAGPEKGVMLEKNTHWKDLYDWSNLENPTRIELNPNNENEKVLRSKIEEMLRENVIVNVLFSQRKRDLESLAIARLTIDIDKDFKDYLGISGKEWRQLVDSSIRILGGMRRYEENERRSHQADPPAKLKDYWKAVARSYTINEIDFVNYANEIFNNFKSINGYKIQSDDIYLIPADSYIYTCVKCNRHHLHPSCNVCTDCYARLERKQITELEINDYYRFLSQEPSAYRRFHSEEMTGQTDANDASKRQQLFQGIFDETDVPLVDEIDILSVTTTMEAGVDIGSLKIVAMSNMPPQRFNYQQRVGRCGRRGSPLSVSLTLCRGRSHDDWYFHNLDKMTGDPSPQPYIDLKSSKIFKRVVLKEMLFYAFRDTELALETSGGESVHGEFGLKRDWENIKDRVDHYFKSEKGILRLEDTIKTLAFNSHLIAKEVIEIRQSFFNRKIIEQISDIAKDSKYSSNALSENLATAGLLPMFGFPTRTRKFHHGEKKYGMRAAKLDTATVDRDLEIAISEYSPGSEIIKDKVKHKAVGIAHYWVQGNDIIPEENPLGKIKTIAFCKNCHILYDNEEQFPSHCPSCKSQLNDGNGGSFATLPIAEPQGFRSDWIERDYREDFEWSSRSSIPRLADSIKDSLEEATVNNTKYKVQEGNVYSLNDNNSELFTFVKAKNNFEGWIEKKYTNLDDYKPALTDKEVTVALASIKNTEVLVLEPSHVSEYVNLNPMYLGVRAGLISFGYLIRRVAATLMDIDAQEIQVGIRSKVNKGNTIGQVFIADQLINGAGYVKYLGRASILQNIVNDMGNDLSFMPNLKTHDCDSSCYTCLRGYENMAFHGLLDWRLALDVAGILNDSSFIPELDNKWKDLIVRALSTLTSNYAGEGLKAMWHEGIPIIEMSNNTCVILRHPLWAKEDNGLLLPRMKRAVEKYSMENYTVLTDYDIFDLIRRPSWLIQDIANKINDTDPFNLLI